MPSRLASCLFACCAGAAAPAGADCPAPDDLGDGIYVTYDDDSMTHYTGERGGRIVERTTILDGSDNVYIVTTLSGLFKLGFVDAPAGQEDVATSETVTYSDDLAALLPVAADQQITTQSTHVYADGAPSRTESYTVLIGAEAQKDIAGCNVTVLPVTHTYASTDGVYSLVQDYIPALGIAIYTGYSELGGPPDVYGVLEFSSGAPKEQ